MVFWITALPCGSCRSMHPLSDQKYPHSFKDPIKLAKFYVASPLVSTKGSKMKTIPFLLNTGE